MKRQCDSGYLTTMSNFLLQRSRNGLASPDDCENDFVGKFISGSAA